MSTSKSLESLLNTLYKSSCKDNVYFDRFRDIAVRRWVGIVTHTAGNREKELNNWNFAFIFIT